MHWASTLKFNSLMPSPASLSMRGVARPTKDTASVNAQLAVADIVREHQDDIRFCNLGVPRRRLRCQHTWLQINAGLGHQSGAQSSFGEVTASHPVSLSKNFCPVRLDHPVSRASWKLERTPVIILDPGPVSATAA